MKTEHEQQTISVAVLLFSDYVERLFTRALERRNQLSTYSEAKRKLSIVAPPMLTCDHEKVPKQELVLRHQTRFSEKPKRTHHTCVTRVTQKRKSKKEHNFDNLLPLEKRQRKKK